MGSSWRRSRTRLNAEQGAAVAALAASLATRKFGVTLLHGITGSGKTEVYLRAIQAALEAGGGVILLVPEVALTPQTVARLRRASRRSRPGHRCVVWHSHLGEGERLDGWLALASGEVRVVVGARSAVFAPVRNLRLIVVDEEHEPAYKQDEIPRYNGRDVAVMRAKLCGAQCLLGSATPSLESYANAQAGRYGLLQLHPARRRPAACRTSTSSTCGSRRRASAGSPPCPAAGRRDAGPFERGEQTILFINRRGYSSSHALHELRARRGVRPLQPCDDLPQDRRDHAMPPLREPGPAPVRCSKCGAPDIRWRGLGTQRVEEAVRRVLPRARIERMDGDSMARRHRFREILGDFRLGKIDVLVGTQMIGKGLDFPNVTLVGLVDADHSMHIPDFRANERTFQLLVQVAGRSGRGDRAGEVVVQTFTPQAEPIQFSRHADFAGFAAAELRLRRRSAIRPTAT